MIDHDETYPRFTVDADGYLIEYADEPAWHYLRHDDEQEVDADKLPKEYPDFIYNYFDVYGGETMTTRKDKIVCPWCGAEQRRGWFDKFGRLTSWDHPSEHIDHNCDECGRSFEVRAEECVYYKTRKVGR